MSSSTPIRRSQRLNPTPRKSPMRVRDFQSATNLPSGPDLSPIQQPIGLQNPAQRRLNSHGSVRLLFDTTPSRQARPPSTNTPDRSGGLHGTNLNYSHQEQGNSAFNKVKDAFNVLCKGLLYCNVLLLSIPNVKSKRKRKMISDSKIPIGICLFFFLLLYLYVNPPPTVIKIASENISNILNNNNDVDDNYPHHEMEEPFGNHSQEDNKSGEDGNTVKNKSSDGQFDPLNSEFYDRKIVGMDEIERAILSLTEDFIVFKKKATGQNDEFFDTKELVSMNNLIDSLTQNVAFMKSQQNQASAKMDTLMHNLDSLQKKQIEVEQMQSQMDMSAMKSQKSSMDDLKNEVDTLHRNLWKLQERNTDFNIDEFLQQIKNLKSRIDVLENEKVPNVGVELSKVTSKFENLQGSFQKIEEELDSKVKTKIRESLQDSPMSKEAIDKQVQSKLNVYDADKVGMPDLALASGGAEIIHEYTSEPFLAANKLLSYFGYNTGGEKPEVVLNSNVNVGMCWALKGTSGSIGIRLYEPIVISHITIDHIAYSLATKLSAPKEVRVWGYTGPVAENLGTFEYDFSAGANPTQTFELEEKQGPYQNVKFEVLSNHGHAEFTCLYRLRVHGGPDGALDFKSGRKKPDDWLSWFGI